MSNGITILRTAAMLSVLVATLVTLVNAITIYQVVTGQL